MQFCFLSHSCFLSRQLHKSALQIYPYRERTSVSSICIDNYARRCGAWFLLSFAGGVARRSRRHIQAIKIRFSDAHNRSGPVLSSHAPSIGALSLTATGPDAAANKKGRKVIEKVEQPRGLALHTPRCM